MRNATLQIRRPLNLQSQLSRKLSVLALVTLRTKEGRRTTMKNVRLCFALACSVLLVLALLTSAVAQSAPGFTVTTFASGIVGARDASTDNAGNVYTVERDQGRVFKISPTGVVSLVVDLPDLFNGYIGYFDPVSGNVFVSRFAHFAGTDVLKITPAGVVSVFASGIPLPSGLTSDAAGFLYVSSFTTPGQVFKLTPGGAVSSFASGLSLPDGLEFGLGGDLFIANRGTNQIMRVPPGGGTATVFASGFNDPLDLTLDSQGNVFVANFNDGTISKVTPTGTVSTLGSGFSGPAGVALDPSGNLFVAEFFANRISKVAGVAAAGLDICLQDDSSGAIFKINSTTGDYSFTNCSGLVLGGTGTLTTRGSQITLQHNTTDRRVLAKIDNSTKRATASVRVFSLGTTFTISDRNTTNNACSCPVT